MEEKRRDTSPPPEQGEVLGDAWRDRIIFLYAHLKERFKSLQWL